MGLILFLKREHLKAWMCVTPTFAVRPFTTLLGPHGSDYAVQRVKLQRKPTELEPSYNHSLSHFGFYTHEHELTSM